MNIKLGIGLVVMCAANLQAAQSFTNQAVDIQLFAQYCTKIDRTVRHWDNQTLQYEYRMHAEELKTQALTPYYESQYTLWLNYMEVEHTRRGLSILTDVGTQTVVNDFDDDQLNPLTSKKTMVTFLKTCN